MKYQSGGAFRRALEDRLRAQGLASGVALVRLRKMVAFDRFLARLMLSQPDAWVLKGGLALQLRLGERARTTKDVDVLWLTPEFSRSGIAGRSNRDLGPRYVDLGAIVARPSPAHRPIPYHPCGC
jgi:hypothetical protein